MGDCGLIMNRKKKVLFITEASYLNTGYAKYGKEVLKRLHKSNKYEIAEFSVYGMINDPRRNTIPWKNFANMPDTENQEQTEIYNSNPSNQFGAWRFERICLEFEPDIVLSIRDFWMDSFIFHSPYRRLFKWAWMPTVDASPQNTEWISMFHDSDYILTYSEWAKSIIEQQAGNTVNTVGVASPSASLDFVPLDKSKTRQELGVPEEYNIIGTVMRNQRRKLFPALLQAFSKYIKKNNDTNTYLYCHTSFPDAGWNLAEFLHDYEISSRIIMTYVCSACGSVDICKFHDARKVCDHCQQYTSTPSSVSNGVPDDILAKIYNVFDIYVQSANSEGFGLPQVEASACGTPVMCTNYSAMKDLVKNISAYPIELSDVYKELETGCDRAVPNQDSMVAIWDSFFQLSDEQRKDISQSTRKMFETNYSWDKTVDQWAKIIEDCPYSQWNDPQNIKPILELPTDQESHKEFMKLIVDNFIYTESQKNSHFVRSMHTDLLRGSTKAVWDQYLVSEFSQSNSKHRPFNRKIILDIMKKRLHNYNVWETVRCDRSKLIDKGEKWLG